MTTTETEPGAGSGEPEPEPEPKAAPKAEPSLTPAAWVEICLRPRAWFTAVGSSPQAEQALVCLVVSALLFAIGREGVEHLLGAPVSVQRVLVATCAAPVRVAVAALVVHAVVRLLRGGGPARTGRGKPEGRDELGTWKVTFAVIAWANAPLALGIVPFLGSVVGLVWSLVLMVIGLAAAHRTTWPRALVASAAGPLVLAAAAVSLRLFVVEAFKIPSGSMQPTLLVGDHIFASKMAYRWGRGPTPGDVIVFEFPENRTQDFVKRVVARGGDTLTVENGHPVVNGRRAPSCKAGVHVEKSHGVRGRQSIEVEELGGHRYLTAYDLDQPARSDGPYSVRQGEYFVLGDDRYNAHDSRGWFDGRGGGVPADHVKGRALVIWLSIANEGGTRGDRYFVSLQGKPACPTDWERDVCDGIRRCLEGAAPFSTD